MKFGNVTDGYGNPPSGWQVIDIDFSAQPSQTLSTDTTYTIAGKTWTKVNSSGDSTSMAIVSGSGLVITPATSTDWFASTFTAPTIEIPIASIVPSFDLTMPIRATMYISSSNESGNYDHTAVILHYGHQTVMYKASRCYSLVVGGQTNNGIDIALNGSRFYQGNTVNNSFRVIQANLPQGVLGFTANSLLADYTSGSGSLPSQKSFAPVAQYSATNPLGGSGTTTVPYTGNSSDWKVAIMAGRAGSGTAYVSTIKQIRVEYKP